MWSFSANRPYISPLMQKIKYYLVLVAKASNGTTKYGDYHMSFVFEDKRKRIKRRCMWWLIMVTLNPPWRNSHKQTLQRPTQKSVYYKNKIKKSLVTAVDKH